MNSSTAIMATSSGQLQGEFNNFTTPGRGRLGPVNPVLASTARGHAVPVSEAAFKPFDDCGAQAEVSVPIAEDQSKPAGPASEALALSLVVALVLGVGTLWAGIVVQLAVLVSQMEPLLVRNILWTHQ